MLMMPPNSFAFEVDNLAATPLAANVGTGFTAGASSADSTAVSVISALAQDVHYVIIGIGGINFGAVDTACLMDLLKDPAGGTAWASFIDDLVCGYTAVPSATGLAITRWYYFPVFIKAGTSLGVQARNARATDTTTGRVVVYCMGGPSRPDAYWCGQKVESLGINAGTSSGTSVTPGDSGTFGSWTTIGTSTGRYGAVQIGVNSAGSSSTSLGYNWQVGYGSTKLAGSPTIYTNNNTSEVGMRLFPTPIPCNVATGTVWQMRGTASGASAQAHDCAVYGVI